MFLHLHSLLMSLKSFKLPDENVVTSPMAIIRYEPKSLWKSASRRYVLPTNNFPDKYPLLKRLPRSPEGMVLLCSHYPVKEHWKSIFTQRHSDIKQFNASLRASQLSVGPAVHPYLAYTGQNMQWLSRQPSMLLRLQPVVSITPMAECIPSIGNGEDITPCCLLS